MRLLSSLLAACLFIFSPMSVLAQAFSELDHTEVRYSSQQPLHYRIAEVDPRLNISQQQLIELSQQAAAIWQKDTGQNYFVYDAKADFVINMVFDERQIRSMQRTENLNQLEHEQKDWSNQNQQLQQLRNVLSDSNTQLESQKTQYQTQLQHYQQALERFKMQGSPTAAFAVIQQQQQALQQLAAQLQTQISTHNQKLQQFNAQTEKSRQLHQQLVSSTEKFNQTFKPQVLHKGQFTGKQIFIYEFSSIDDLRLTLAHEFGHALGLKHTHDPKSLMYPRIKEQDAKDFQLTNTDLGLLGLSR